MGRVEPSRLLRQSGTEQPNAPARLLPTAACMGPGPAVQVQRPLPWQPLAHMYTSVLDADSLRERRGFEAGFFFF